MIRKKIKDFIIAFDFDGTITEGRGNWPEAGTPNRGMINAMRFLYDYGFQIVINTLRSPGDDGNAYHNFASFIAAKGIPWDEINENIDYLISAYGDSRKIAADIYVDDRNAGGLISPKELIKDVIVRFSQKIKSGACILPDQEINEEFIDEYTERYLKKVCKTTIRRKIRDDEEY